jgi:trans-2,3-dihydro-3-hydroxyanthranilate isomerase
MTQPPAAPIEVDGEGPILEALGVPSGAARVFGYQNGPEHVYIELGSEGAVSALEPNLAALGRATKAGVFAFFFDGKLCRARCFVPGSFVPSNGVAEDPATGSAVGPLALHLMRHGRLDAGQVLRVEQGGEMGRPSTLYARIGGGDAPSIEVGGTARIVARGQFTI